MSMTFLLIFKKYQNYTQVGKELGITVHYVDLGAMYDQTEYEWVLIDKEGYEAITGMETTTTEAAEVLSDFGATPMTLVIEEGKVIGGVMGAVDKTTLKDTLSNVGIKK